MKGAGVYGRRYFYPLISDMPMYRGLPSAAADNLTNSKRTADKVICLPIYPDLDDGQLDVVAAIIAGVRQ
jgi:dTDP-4-amino-4,6-dideoxygalactose transaminase